MGWAAARIYDFPEELELASLPERGAAVAWRSKFATHARRACLWNENSSVRSLAATFALRHCPHIDATNMIGQPVIDELHEAVSVSAFKACDRVPLFEHSEVLKELWMGINVLFGCRALTSPDTPLFEAEMKTGVSVKRF
jgi:hypothetical protein